MINMKYIKEEAFNKSVCRKMAPPLGKYVVLISQQQNIHFKLNLSHSYFAL